MSAEPEWLLDQTSAFRGERHIAFCGAIVLAGPSAFGTDLDLDYSLLKEAPGVSASGTNTICLPYDLDNTVFPNDKVDDLVQSIGTASLQCVLRFSSLAEDFDRVWPVGPHGRCQNDESVPCATDNDCDPPAGPDGTCLTHVCDDYTSENFDLVPGEGYRIMMKEDVTYNVTGSHVATVEIEFEGPVAGTSSGMNDYCPPYNGVAAAAEFAGELDGCKGGVCSQGTCNGGFNAGASCSKKFISASRYLRETDGLEVYAGVLPNGNFDIASGESYRIQVSEDVSLMPLAYDTDDFALTDIDIVIEGRPPAPCDLQGVGGFDGGILEIRNFNPTWGIRVEYHGGDSERETTPTPADGITNLLFLPWRAAGGPGPTDCGGVNPGSCASVCPGPGSPHQGCEEIDCGPILPGKCGCEIADNVRGFCGAPETDYVRCDDDRDCSVGSCIRSGGDIAPLGRGQGRCNQVGCQGDVCGAGVNCCDQPQENCLDPALIRCTVPSAPGETGVVRNPEYEFTLKGVSLDFGKHFTDPVARGVVFLPDQDLTPFVTEVNCCEYVCSGSCGTSCSSDSECGSQGFGACISKCEGVCSVGGDSCLSARQCDDDVNDACVRTCP